jgi:DNA polymerase-3 subunit delta'
MSLAELIGNTRIKATLASYLRNQRIPSGMIFTGSDAYHQLLFALNFAKSMNCLEKKYDACDRCHNCLAIGRNIFPDVQVMAPEGQYYRKSQMDDLIETASRRPMQTEKKIFILKNAQCLNEMAANSFLKTLEEPLPTNVFILLASNLNLILPTIQSRCQILKFLPLSKSEIRLEFRQKGVDPEKSRLLAYFSSESLENMSEVDWQELEEKRSAILCILDRLLRQSAVEDILLDLYDRSRSRESFIAYFREMVNLISVLLRDIMILMFDGSSTALINLDYKEKLMELAALTNIDKIFFLIRKMEFLLRDIQRNLNARVLVLEFINSYAPESANPGQGTRPLGGGPHG